MNKSTISSAGDLCALDRSRLFAYDGFTAESGPGLVARKLGAAAAPVAAFSRLYGVRLRAWFRLWRAVLGGGDPCRS